MKRIRDKIRRTLKFVKIRVRIVQEIINWTKTKVYLEIGVRYGITFLQIKAPIKIAVDPLFDIIKLRKILLYIKNPINLFNNKYYEMTSDDFFAHVPKIITEKGIDVVLIDGLHTFEQSLKDCLNSLKYLNDNGVIVMHDCNPMSATIGHRAKSQKEAKNLNLEGWDGSWSGDVWKTIVYLRSTRKELNIFVLNCDSGLGIITRGQQEFPLKYSLNEVKELSYKDLEKDREKLLNLKNPKYFLEFVKTL